MMMRVLDRVRPKEAADEQGFTMIEVVVTLVIMSIVMVIFSTGIAQVFGVQNKVDAASNAQGQLTIAFQKLDKQIRYASGISQAGTLNGDPVVEYLTSFTGVNTCTELRLHNNQLQQRTWLQSSAASPPVPSPTVLAPLASYLSGSTPFTVTDAGATYNYQQLEIAVTATYGTGRNAISRQSDITFTALNTTQTANNDSVCTEGRSAPWA
jgi:prepilin-type N-terminal cleavage/methylation domain-containing protein